MKPLIELTLEEMLADPIVHLVMARDGVRADDVRALMRRVFRWPSPVRREAALLEAA